MGTRNQRVTAKSAPYVIPLSLDASETLSFAPERQSGWAAYFSDELEEAGMGVQLRIGPRRYEGEWDDELAKPALEPPVIPADVPLEIRQVTVTTKRGANMRSYLLRSIPFERIEAAVNRPVHREVISEWLLPPMIEADNPRLKSVDWRIRPGMIHPAPAKPRRPQLKLRVPEGYRKPDQFYADVADRFLWLATFTSRPGQELAEANDVKPSTVHRWIREAKARGLLVLPDSKGESR